MEETSRTNINGASGSDPLVDLHSLWVGPSLGYLERLCLASAGAAGHNLTLWTYEPKQLKGVPEGTSVRDAAEIMPFERLLRYRDTGSVALGANLWRIELLATGLGCWVDMDFIFLKPLAFNDPYIFGWEYENWINNAVLYAPKGSQMVRDLQAIPQPNTRPPWWGPRRSLQFYWSRFRRGRLDLEDYPWGTFSAGLVTHVVKKNKLQRYAQPPEVFYPIRWSEARMLYGPAEAIEQKLTEDTCAVHMWHSRLEGLRDKQPPAGSYIEKMCNQFNV
ncbi:hypothetical protein G7A66_12850 [Altererythrobacter sp. SALINAS58]|uniref:hypothetical protein n=1 Tax=Alteripontixanthobacter muriae TaxID=2705546 RepID=UPI0015764FEF|nr:hypothetical protein [Alteripontixanthobacter muriae]NTZ43957.1 hypothetical protein [Alteripontixanthobacter muriae]